jgi:hypothetical protein
MHRTISATLSLVLFSAVPALAAAATDFTGPAGWSVVDNPAPPAPNQTIKQWHLAGDISTLIFIKDPSTPYSDALDAIEKNFSTNKIKAAADKDVPCQGKTGHVIEFGTGPSGHQTIINRVLVPDGPGVDTITYFRSDGSPFDPDVKKAETDFCGP